MKILVLKFSALGDVVRTSYILPGLHDKYDNLVIDWITSNAAYELLSRNPYIRTLASPQSGLEFLKSDYYDLVLSFDDEYEVLKLLEGVNCGKIIGAYLQDGGRSYSHDASEWFDMGLISKHGKDIADVKKKKNTREHNQIFSEMLGINIRSGCFFNSKLIERRIAREFDKSVFNIGINPSAGPRWKSKEMPFDEVCRLIEQLMQCRVANKNIKIHLLGGKAEELRNAEIIKHVNACEVRDWGGNNTLLEFAAIVKACDYMISSDSLSLHLAISQKISNLSYYAPTSADEIGTFGTGVKVISLSADYCSYSADADNSTITADRLLNALKVHCLELKLPFHRKQLTN
jgi:heptosyltransferase-2